VTSVDWVKDGRYRMTVFDLLVLFNWFDIQSLMAHCDG